MCTLMVHTVDSRYLEFDGTMEKIRVNRSWTQEELMKIPEVLIAAVQTDLNVFQSVLIGTFSCCSRRVLQ